jgi:hypothetical protein
MAGTWPFVTDRVYARRGGDFVPFDLDVSQEDQSRESTQRVGARAKPEHQGGCGSPGILLSMCDDFQGFVLRPFALGPVSKKNFPERDRRYFPQTVAPPPLYKQGIRCGGGRL